MAPKKKPAAKKSAAKAPVKKAPAKASAPVARTKAANGTPAWVNNFLRYAEKNPAMALVGVIAVALALMLIFG